MLSKENEAFLAYWEKNREQQLTSIRPLLVGLSTGLAIGIGVVLLLESGLFERATMVANSRLSSFVLVLAIVIVSVGMAFFYRKFRWEMMEQRFLELQATKNKAESQTAMQP